MKNRLLEASWIVWGLEDRPRGGVAASFPRYVPPP